MKKLMIAAGGLALSVGSAFAEGATAPTPSSTATSLETALQEYITSASGALVTLLTAGIVIFGTIFIFRVLRKGLNASK